MPLTFVDTSYFVAVIDPRDMLREVAEQIGKRLAAQETRLVTSEPVLFEVLNYFSRYDGWHRTRALELVQEVLDGNAFRVVRTDRDLLTVAMQFYGNRIDQPYSLTDCATMEICRQLEITDILTADTDFEREGFGILLKPQREP